MPRKPRQQFSDTYYHIMNRGTDHRDLFFTQGHGKLFLCLLDRISKLYNIEVFCYCLMNNHYHLLLKTQKSNLPQAMQYLNGTYAKNVNKLLGKDGALFRGRYHSKIVSNDIYLLQLSRYIHLNHVTAKLVRQAESYKWSSCKFYLSQVFKPDWLNTNFILEQFGRQNARKRYCEFLYNGL